MRIKYCYRRCPPEVFFDKDGNDVNLVADGEIVYVGIRAARINMFDTKKIFDIDASKSDEYIYLKIASGTKENVKRKRSFESF